MEISHILSSVNLAIEDLNVDILGKAGDCFLNCVAFQLSCDGDSYLMGQL